MKTKQKQWGKILAVFALFGISLFATPVSYAALTDGLVAYYSFDDCTAKDNSGNGHDGTIKGSPTCEAGVIKKALSFNINRGENDYIDLGTTFPSPKQFTLSAWINIANLPDYSWNHEGTIFAKGGGGDASQISYFMSIDRSFDEIGHIRQDIGDGSGDYMSVNTVSDTNFHPLKMNQWLHLVSTYDGQTLSIYGNGKKISSTTSSFYKQNAALIPQDNGLAAAIGKSLYDSTPTAFSGLLDDIKIYNRVLTAAEITALYNQSNPIQGTAPWKTAHTVTCQNITQNKSVVIPKTKVAAWNCEQAGLSVNHGDKVKVTIDGTKY